MKFLHAADLHLDSPLKGLQKYEGAPHERLRGATRRALENLVELAIREEVDFVLLAGDLYDGDWKDYNTGLFFVNQMRRLRAAQIPAFVISGNHDAANKMTRSLALPEGITMLSEKQPQTVRLDDLQVAIHGQSFAKQAVAENLARTYPAAERGWYNIGVLHTSLEAPEGEHKCYAPCSLQDLISREYDYWALGHIHKREQFGEAGQSPTIAFSGNIQGRHIRETGEKGCLIVEVDRKQRTTTRFEPLDVLRWELCRVDASEASDDEQVLECFTRSAEKCSEQHAGMPLALRVSIEGRSAAHEGLTRSGEQFINELRSQATATSDGLIWVEKVQIRTSSVSQAAAAEPDGPIGELRQLFQELAGDEAGLKELAATLDDVFKKLPSELREGDEPLALDDPAWLRQTLAEAEPLLVGRLLAGKETS
jgi:DNA repair exonuclease SbcCD nuclease subunit